MIQDPPRCHGARFVRRATTGCILGFPLFGISAMLGCAATDRDSLTVLRVVELEQRAAALCEKWDEQLFVEVVSAGARIPCAAAGQRLRLRPHANMNPLHYLAWKSGSREAVARLVDQGADVDATASDGRTPLHYAAAVGAHAIVDELLDRGADPEAVARRGWTPLLFAVHAKSSGAVAGLLDAGADVNAGADHTPLLAAVYMRSLTLVEQLLDAGGDPSKASSATGHTPLLLAARLGSLDVFDAISRAIGERLAAWHVVDAQGSNLLHHAAFAASTELVRMALAKGVPPTARNALGNTPLHELAMALPRAEALTALLDAGADPNAPNARGLTPLHFAMSPGKTRLKAALAMLERGADASAANEFGLTSLHLAAYAGSEQLVAALLMAGAGASSRDDRDRTPLHHAIVAGADVGLVSRLLENGADPNAADGAGATPLHLAAYWHNDGQTVAALLGRGAAAADAYGRTPSDWLNWRSAVPAEIESLLHDANASAPR